ncbi:hypothetical protein ECEC1847_4366, partial [Escherichia coli EC1847]
MALPARHKPRLAI